MFNTRRKKANSPGGKRKRKRKQTREKERERENTTQLETVEMQRQVVDESNELRRCSQSLAFVDTAAVHFVEREKEGKYARTVTEKEKSTLE